MEVKIIKELRINEEIRSTEVRLVDQASGTQDVLSLRDAMDKAVAAGLDLVEISPNAKPPVCRIMDYGKYRFEQIKREKEAKKNQKIVQIKEVKLRPNIEDHDFETKARNAEKFLGEGDKVKVSIMFRGREITHPELGQVLCDRMAQRLEAAATVEKPAKIEGRNMVVVFNPLNNQ